MSEIQINVLDGIMLKQLTRAGLAWLEQHKTQVNQMNVFPVPDGDTGTNMWHTLQSAYASVADVEEIFIGRMLDQFARGALRGARGNSGTILAMLLRGFANALVNDAQMDGQKFAKACDLAVSYTYATINTVMKPIEGTILTVARRASEAVNAEVGTHTDLHILFDKFVESAKQALEETPNQLPILKEAGVVDSGGMGLVMIFEGMQRVLRGETIDLIIDSQPNDKVSPAWENALMPEEEAGYGYDVQFLMIGENLPLDTIRQQISAMGWSPLIDGDDRLIKVHIHVNNPAEPLDYAIRLGAQLDDVVVENMQAQYLRYVNERKQRETMATLSHELAVVAVSPGVGIARVMQQYGVAQVIMGGQTMNPSVEDFVKAIESLPNQQVIILPNNSNVILSAIQATQLLINKVVKVVPSKTIPQGISALLAYADRHTEDGLDDVVQAMVNHTHLVKTLEITTASRTIESQGIRVGEWLGLLDDQPCTSGNDLQSVMDALLSIAQAQQSELLTIYWGRDVTQQDAHMVQTHIQDTFSNLTIETLFGGQPLYPYIMSLE